LCENTLTFWEENKIKFQKNNNIESTSCDMFEEMNTFFISLLSLLSSVVTQWALKMNNDLLCLIWLRNLVNFAFVEKITVHCVSRLGDRHT